MDQQNMEKIGELINKQNKEIKILKESKKKYKEELKKIYEIEEEIGLDNIDKFNKIHEIYYEYKDNYKVDSVIELIENICSIQDTIDDFLSQNEFDNLEDLKNFINKYKDKQKKIILDNTEIDDLIVDYNLSIYNKEVNDDYYRNQIYDSIHNINLKNIPAFKNKNDYPKVTLNNAYYYRFFKEIITNKKNKFNISKKSNPKNKEIKRPQKVTLNNCLYNRFKNDEDNKKKEKAIYTFKKSVKKIKIINIFAKELNVKRNYNISINNLFNKVKNNLNNKICIKFNNPKNEMENLFSININSKYNEIDSQSKLGGLFVKENINNKSSLKKYIKINDNFYLNSLINNENRISRFINFCKKIYYLNKYLSIDTIIYCRFLNEIRDMSDDMFFDLLNLLSK